MEYDRRPLNNSAKTSFFRRNGFWKFAKKLSTARACNVRCLYTFEFPGIGKFKNDESSHFRARRFGGEGEMYFRSVFFTETRRLCPRFPSPSEAPPRRSTDRSTYHRGLGSLGVFLPARYTSPGRLYGANILRERRLIYCDRPPLRARYTRIIFMEVNAARRIYHGATISPIVDVRVPRTRVLLRG